MTITPGRAGASAPPRRVPGEVGLWVFVLGDMCAFTLFFATFLFLRRDRHGEFAAAHATLSTGLGLANTILLLTGSLFVAVGVAAHRRSDAHAPIAFAVAGVTGAAFVIDKIVEYAHLTRTGRTPQSGEFFSTFYLFTGIHLLHVLIALVVLLMMSRAARRSPPRARELRTIESGAVYWHMVDLLWLVLFCLYYLMG